VGQDVRLGDLGGYVVSGGPSAVVVLHEWDGVVVHTLEVAERVAAEGFTAVALDLYDGDTARDDAEAARLQRRILRDPAAAAARVAGAVEELRRRGHDKVAALGFCTGASLALLTSASSPIDATVAYYGIFEDHADREVTNPVLIHLAEHEEYYPSAERFRSWFEGMSNVAIHVYPGTRHAFFDETVPTHYDAAAASLSWARTISFLRQHLAGSDGYGSAV
jgi:carboxymethylenebutenolidase